MKPDALHTNHFSAECDSRSRRPVLSDGPGAGQSPAVICGKPESERTGAPTVQLEITHGDQTERRVQERQAGTGAVRRERHTPEDANWSSAGSGTGGGGRRPGRSGRPRQNEGNRKQEGGVRRVDE